MMDRNVLRNNSNHSSESIFMANHHAHDAEYVLNRLKAIAERIGAEWTTLIDASDNAPEVGVFSLKGDPARPSVYLSAGIHGDEPAGVLGLLDWADSQLTNWTLGDVVIFPLLNPWGLINNSRVDQRGKDLNRAFDSLDAPLVASWKRFLGSQKFAVAICLHEDFDARGCYCYEIYRTGKPRFGRDSLEAACDVIPMESNTKIEGRDADRGLLDLDEIPEMDEPGAPEAFPLYRDYAEVTMTFETPSEYSLYARVRAHEKFLCHVVARLRGR